MIWSKMNSILFKRILLSIYRSTLTNAKLRFFLQKRLDSRYCKGAVLHNPSYQFGFDVKDDEFTNYQNRKEQREGNVIKGSYSVVDSDGFIRTVTYTADPKEGFKAEVSRQPTDIVVKIPKPIPEYQQQSGPVQHQQPRIQAQPQKVRPDYSQYQ